jgi:hypothetical protein
MADHLGHMVVIFRQFHFSCVTCHSFAQQELLPCTGASSVYWELLPRGLGISEGTLEGTLDSTSAAHVSHLINSLLFLLPKYLTTLAALITLTTLTALLVEVPSLALSLMNPKFYPTEAASELTGNFSLFHSLNISIGLALEAEAAVQTEGIQQAKYLAALLKVMQLLHRSV